MLNAEKLKKKMKDLRLSLGQWVPEPQLQAGDAPVGDRDMHSRAETARAGRGRLYLGFALPSPSERWFSR